MRTRPHVVRSGDYLTAIAHSSGIDRDVLWNDPANSNLRALRKSPELLAPGDVIYIPVVARQWLAVSVGATNSYVATVPTVEVHVVLKGSDGTPLAGKPVTTEPILGPDPLTTDGSGALVLEVPIDVRLVRARVGDPPVIFDIRIGYLDPNDVSTGAASRLRQLGYVGDERWVLARERWYLDGIDDATDVAVRYGTAAFQADQQVPVTGEMDDDTTQKLRDEYGC